MYSLKHLLSGLNQLTNKAQTGNTADNFGCRIKDKHQLLRYVFVFICRRKGTKYGSQIKLQAKATKCTTYKQCCG